MEGLNELPAEMDLRPSYGSRENRRFLWGSTTAYPRLLLEPPDSETDVRFYLVGESTSYETRTSYGTLTIAGS